MPSVSEMYATVASFTFVFLNSWKNLVWSPDPVHWKGFPLLHAVPVQFMSKYVPLFATKSIYVSKQICLLRLLFLKSFCSIIAWYIICAMSFIPVYQSVGIGVFSFFSKPAWTFSYKLLIDYYCHSFSHPADVWIWPSNRVNKEK